MDKTTKDAWLGKKENLSQDALEKRRSINKKLMLFGCLPIFLFVSAILFLVSTRSGSTSSSSSTSTSSKIEESQEHRYARYIPGLRPSDVYLNLEKRGFNTESSFDTELGNLWTSKYRAAGVNYTVETFSYKTDSVVSVRATAMVDVNGKDIVATKQFFQFVSTLPYTNANPEQAASWLGENFNSDQATTQIGGVTFTMIAPTQYVRMLRIEVTYGEASEK